MNLHSNKLLDLLKVKPTTQPIKRKRVKWNRNWKCFCGSDKKYKKCCWEEVEKLTVVDQNATVEDGDELCPE
jgi:hypothetical protein